MTNDDVNNEMKRLLHNEKVRSNIMDFLKTGKLLNDAGNEIKIGKSVNYQLTKQIGDI